MIQTSFLASSWKDHWYGRWIWILSCLSTSSLYLPVLCPRHLPTPSSRQGLINEVKLAMHDCIQNFEILAAYFLEICKSKVVKIRSYCRYYFYYLISLCLYFLNRYFIRKHFQEFKIYEIVRSITVLTIRQCRWARLDLSSEFREDTSRRVFWYFKIPPHWQFSTWQ